MVKADAAEAPAPDPFDGPHFKLFQIEFYVLLTATILVFLVFFGSFRRRCHNGVFKIMVWASYVLSSMLIIYTLGQMQSASASFFNEYFGIWASFLFMVLVGSADSISAYSLEDNELRVRFLSHIVIKLIWLALLIRVHDDNNPKLGLLLWLLYAVTLMKIGERLQTFKLASRDGLARNTRLITDFMGYEHDFSSNDEVDPSHMKGYNYLVRGEKEKMAKITPPHYHQKIEIKDIDEVITIHKIWQCKGRLLTRDPDDQLKDLCISFALFKLICRRFAGFPSWECIRAQEKTWNFVRYGILSKDDDYERPFRVIEVELSFLFDLFYTKYPALFQAGQLKCKIIEIISIIIGCLVAANVFRHNHRLVHCVNCVNFDADVIVTGVVMITLLSLEVVQIFFIIFSDWAKVSLICKYVRTPYWQKSICIEKMIEFICRGRILKPWERKIAQYSLLSSFNYNPSRLLYNCLTSTYLDSPGKGRKASTWTKLPAEVKKAIVLSLKSLSLKSDGTVTLSNGVASLLRNGVHEELKWSCKLESTVHIIMVWHIATTLCELKLSKSVSSSLREHFIVATSLSKYCAHLVAFAPRFLPDNASLSEFIFNQVVIETRDFLKECKSMEERFEKMMASGDRDSRETVIKRSAVLGKYLIRSIESEEQRWKILADFWAELVLFVAPSNEVTIHSEYVARGGEFITHLWALLSHAGIIKQTSSTAVPAEGCGVSNDCTYEYVEP